MTQQTGAAMAEDPGRFTDPATAIDHMRNKARQAAAEAGYEAAAAAVMALRREHRIMPLKRQEAAPDRLATWDAVRVEARALVPMAMGAHGGIKSDLAAFEQRVNTLASQPLPPQPDWAPDPMIALQAAALRTPASTTPSPPVQTPGAVDRSPRR